MCCHFPIAVSLFPTTNVRVMSEFKPIIGHRDNGVIVQALNHHFMTHVPLHLTNDKSNKRTQC